MDDEDDVPDELWSMLDTISHQKSLTVSQAPHTFQQPQSRPPDTTNVYSAGPESSNGAYGNQWKTNLVQQLPTGAPSKPKSLAQQLAGDSSKSLFPSNGANQPQNPPGSAPPRWTPPPQVQHQYPQHSRSSNAGNLTGSTQQWSARPCAPEDPNAGAFGTGTGAILAAELGLPPLHVGNTSAAGTATAVTAAATGSCAVTTPQQQPANTTMELCKLQQELQQHAELANQLRSRLAAAEQERLQLHQEKQQLQQRSTSYSQHSMAQHRTQELQRQVATYQERLMFAEQEARDAQASAAEKASRARETEVQLKQLQEELRRKEEAMQQLEVELEQEKQRTQRVTSAAAAGPAQAQGTSSALQPSALLSPTAEGRRATLGSAGRKRPDAATAGTPGVSSAAKSSARVTTLPAHVTPQQQLRHQQMTQLLGGPPPAISFDVDMYEGVWDEASQQQQQQQQPQTSQQQSGVPRSGQAGVATAPATANGPAEGPTASANVHDAAQQPASLQSGEQLPRDCTHHPLSARQQRDAAEASPLPAHPEQQSLSSSLARGVLPVLQRIQRPPLRLPQLLWSSCQTAMQQLLQPLSSHLAGINSFLAATCTAAVRDPSTVHPVQHLPAALSSAQQQLSLFTAGAVSSGTALFVSLLKLAAVLVPGGIAGPSGGISSSRDFADSAAVAAMQTAFPNAAEQLPCKQAKWLFMPTQSGPLQSNSGTEPVPHTQRSHKQQPQGQDPEQWLMFRSTCDPGVLHVLPVSLVSAVLCLLQHLVRCDQHCLWFIASQLCQPAVRHPAGVDSSTVMHGRMQAANNNVQISSSRSSSSRVHIKWVTDSGHCQSSLGHQQQQLSSQTGALSSMTSRQQQSLAGVQAVTLPTIYNSDIASAGGTWDAEQQHKGSLVSMLFDAAKCSNTLLQQVGLLLCSVAAELPPDSRSGLLAVALYDHCLLLLLLQANSISSRCTGADLLLQLTACPSVCESLASSLLGAAHRTACEQQQQQGVDHGHVDGSGDVVMIDGEQVNVTAALQPLDNRTAAISRAAAGDTLAKAARQQQQQQVASTGGSATPQQHREQAQLACQERQRTGVNASLVQEVLLQLLECFTYGLQEAINSRQQLWQQHSASCILWVTSSTTTGPRKVDFDPSQQPEASAESSAVGGWDHSISPAQGWGAFELQRRCCAVLASLLQRHQLAPLLHLMDPKITAGYGLAQRLLVLVDTVFSQVCGDPFAALTPHTCGTLPAVTTQAVDADEACSSVCGRSCSWQACLERVRLGHEALLLLRALVATPGSVGTGAMTDLASNSASLRLIMTTRAKLAEVTAAILAAAAAGRAAAAVAHGPAASSAAPAMSMAACALPLQPWAWPWSAQCGCQSSKVSSSTAGNTTCPGQQLLSVQHPLLSLALQEMANTAASIHRRIMIHLRAQETV